MRLQLWRERNSKGDQDRRRRQRVRDAYSPGPSHSPGPAPPGMRPDRPPLPPCSLWICQRPPLRRHAAVMSPRFGSEQLLMGQSLDAGQSGGKAWETLISLIGSVIGSVYELEFCFFEYSPLRGPRPLLSHHSSEDPDAKAVGLRDVFIFRMTTSVQRILKS